MGKSLINKIMSVFLAFVLAVTGIITCPITASAGTVTESHIDRYYYLSVGFQPVEYAGGRWQNGQWKKTESNLPFSLTVPTYGEGTYEITNVYAFSKSNSSLNKLLKFGENCGYTVEANSIGNFADKYGPYLADSVFNIKWSASGRYVSGTYSATMHTESELELGKYAFDNTALKARTLMWMLLGDEERYKTYDPITYNAIISVTNDANPNSHTLYPVFTPVIIEYTRTYESTKEIGDIEANLSMPASAKQGENFTVKDASLVDSDIEYASGVLERKLDSGDYITIATWPGPGVKGANSGESVQENFAEIGTVLYRLTVRTSGGQESVCEKSINIIDGREINGSAKLQLPTATYEGHTVTAGDNSEFTVDGTYWSAAKAYAEGIASNYLDADGRVSRVRGEKTAWNVVFSDVGTKVVTLEVDVDNLGELTDTKTIDVHRTPAVIPNISGVQKQNRKQVITADIATNPKYPLTSWYVIVEDTATGEKVRLDAAGESAAATNIKTRAVTFTTDVSGEWSHIRLEFLTKNPGWDYTGNKGTGANPDGTEPYSYEIYVRDTRGNEDIQTGDFNVRPDEPPRASLSLEDSFLRAEGTNTAEITVSDLSTTDGDSLEREWYRADIHPLTGTKASKTKITNYTDKSFGSGQTISFNKDGVGETEVTLIVKDVWTEETLPEYVFENERLTASAIATTKVLDVAPMVSLDPISYIKSSIYMLTKNKEDYDELNAIKTDLKSELLASGIVPEINIDLMSVVPFEEWSDEEKAEGERHLLPFSPYHFAAISSYGVYDSTTGNGAAEARYFMYTDKDHYYVQEGTWQLESHYTKDSYPEHWNYSIQMPYMFTAYDIYTNELLWTMTVNRDMLSCSNTANNHFVSDITNKYLFYKGDTQTMIINRDSGAILGYIPAVIGDDIFCTDDTIYYITADGLYTVDQNLIVSKAYSGKVALHDSWSDIGGAARLIDRNIVFVTCQGQNIYKTTFNIDSGKLTFQELACGQKTFLNVNVIGISEKGSLVIGRTYIGDITVNCSFSKNGKFIDNSKYTEGTEVFCFDEKGNLLSEIDGIPANKQTVVAWNAENEYDYLVSVTNTSNNYTLSSKHYSNYYTRAYLYSINDGALKATYSNDNSFREYNGKSGYRVQANQLIFAYDNGETVVLHAGGWKGTTYLGLSLSYLEMQVPSACLVFTPADGTASLGSTAFWGGYDIDLLHCDHTSQLYGGFTSPYYMGANMISSYATNELDTSGDDYDKWAYISQKPIKLDDLYASYLKRNLTNDSDLSAVILYDSTAGNTESSTSDYGQMNNSSQTIEDSGVLSIISKIGDNTSYLSNIKENLSSAGVFSSISELVENLAIEIKGYCNLGYKSGNSLTLKKGSGAISLSKEYNLNPLTTYYYDVDSSVSNIHVTATTRLNSDEKAFEYFSGKQFRVVEEHNEDFSSYENRDTFFSTGSFSNGKYFVVASEASSATTLTREIGFTVPKGKVALISFDVLKCYSAGGCKVEIQNELGEVIEWQQGTSFSSHVLIPEGKNKIVFTQITSSSGDYIWTIDNLHASILEECTPFLSSEKGSFDYVLTSGGAIGSFTTLSSGNTIYREVESTSFDVDPVDYNSITNLWASENDQYYSYIIETDGLYDLDLYGPASNSAGGYLRGRALLEKGDRIDVFLGEGVPVTGSERTGENGINASGYDNIKDFTYEDVISAPSDGTRLAAIYINGELAMVSGGGGSRGYDGVGTTSTIASGSVILDTIYRRSCPYCGTSTSQKKDHINHTYVVYGCTGGAGGMGGTGGARTATGGNFGGSPTPSPGTTKGQNVGFSYGVPGSKDKGHS